MVKPRSPGRMFLMAICFFGALGWCDRNASAAGRGGMPPQSSPQTTPALQRQDLMELENKMEQYAAQQAQIAASTAANSIAATARETESRADSAILYLTIIAAIGIAVVGFGVTVTIFQGYQEGGRIKTARELAEALRNDAVAQLNRVNTQVQDIEAAKTRIDAADESVRRSISATSDFFGRFQNTFRERLGIVGQLTRLPPPEAVARFEEADILIVIADNNNSVNKRDLAEPFTTLGFYWRTVGNLERAIARFFRALELKPDDLRARRGLCGALYNLAAATERGPLKKDLLDRAQQQCDEAMKIDGNNPRVWFDQGWILDERGDYENAVEAYRRAQLLDFKNEWPNSTYNLACTLAKWGRLAASLEELKKVLGVENNWEDALDDPDLQPLRDHPELGADLKILCEGYAKKASVNRGSSSSAA
jgi:tetratricopeptide (TPR) repeat protein